MTDLFPEPRTTEQPHKAQALGHVMLVPAGVEWFPNVPWSPSEAVWEASLYHDVLYFCQGDLTRSPATLLRDGKKVQDVGRHFSDRFFLQVMKEEGEPMWKRRAIYYTVRAIGYPVWLETDDVSSVEQSPSDLRG